MFGVQNNFLLNNYSVVSDEPTLMLYNRFFN